MSKQIEHLGAVVEHCATCKGKECQGQTSASGHCIGCSCEGTKNDHAEAGCLRYDRSAFKGKAVKTKEGFIRADAVVTRAGVFHYFNADGSDRLELRHPSDVFKADSLETLKMRPVTNGHPLDRIVTADNAKALQIGMTGEAARRDENDLMIPLIVTDAKAVADVKNGKKELSCGYECDLIKEDGEFDGQAYTHRQINIRYNHVAVVGNGRAGAMARINMDSRDAIQNEITPARRSRMKITLDGIEYEADAEVVNALKKAQERITTDAAELETLKGERDTLKVKCDAADARDMKAEITAGVTARLALISKAQPIVGKDVKLDGLGEDEIRNVVIAKRFPEIKLDGKPAAYLDGVFEVAVSAKPDMSPAAVNAARSAAADVHIDAAGDDAVRGSDSARDQMIARNRDAYKSE